MAVFHHSIVIASPVEIVFEAVADVRTHPKWQAGLIETEIASDHSSGVGMRGVEVRRLFGRITRFPFEITIYDPPRRWGFRALAGPVRPAAILTFSRHAEATQLESELSIPGPLGFLLGRAMLSQQRQNYQHLKELLESGKL